MYFHALTYLFISLQLSGDTSPLTYPRTSARHELVDKVIRLIVIAKIGIVVSNYTYLKFYIIIFMYFHALTYLFISLQLSGDTSPLTYPHTSNSYRCNYQELQVH